MVNMKRCAMFKKGFWSGDKPWESTGPMPGQVNELVRRHRAQQGLQPPNPRRQGSELEMHLSQAANRLRKAALKKKRQAKALQVSSSSSSSSSASSSASASAGEP